MAKTKNAQPSKKPSRGSASASPITPPAPPAPATGALGSSSAPTKSARKSKTQARKSVINLASPPVVASPIAFSTPGFGDHDESHSSDHTFSKSSSSNGAPNVDKAMVTLPTVVSSSSKAKNLKENPPSVSSSDSEPEEETEESEEPEADHVTTKPVPVPAAVPKKDKGKRPIVSSSPPPQGKVAQRKARFASPGITNDLAAASASTSAPTEMAEFSLRLGRMETSQALLLRKMDSIMKYFRPNDDE
ncbi:uncharacterized protein LOC133030574 [Cannabis sativa]|uniref:uncharacterized protein LOC133030574 n=1 Tax=Cannabis sativa TaxID=3483 RepID=UPI0029CA4122|nr:uncharacterized protein LOC133030574 [Cannabis sativa]